MVGTGKRHKDSNTPFSLSILFFPIHIMQRYQGECLPSKLDIFMLARMEHSKGSNLSSLDLYGKTKSTNKAEGLLMLL